MKLKTNANMKYQSYSSYILLIAYCIIYVITINECLMPDLMNGPYVVTSYNKSFSLPLCIVCIMSVLLLYWITETVTNDNDSVTSYAIKVLFLLYQIPVSMTLCLFNRDKMFNFWIIEMIYWINICLVLYFFKKRKFKFTLAYKFPALPTKLVRVILIGVLFLGVALSIRSLGSFDFSISLSDVYGYRRYYKSNSNDFMTFFKSAMGIFLGPCLITYYIYKRKLIPSILFILMQIVFFSFARDKAYLFLLPIAILLGIFGDKVVDRFNSYMSYVYVLISGFSLLATFNIFRTAIFELLIRRTFVIPSFFNYLYFYFFDTNEPIWWRQDTFLIDKLFSPVYEDSVPLVMANRMMNGRETNPNAGMFAEAYSRCGFWGIFIYPILIILVLKLIDKCFKSAPKIAKIALAGCIAVVIGNDVITSTSFVCTLALLVLGSTYFRERDMNNKMQNDTLPEINDNNIILKVNKQ